MSTLTELADRFNALPLDEQVRLLARHRKLLEREVPEVLEVYLAAREVQQRQKEREKAKALVIKQIRQTLQARAQAAKAQAWAAADLRDALAAAIAANRPRLVVVSSPTETYEQLELVA